MAGDDDFIESGKVGGWVGGNGHPDYVHWYVHIFWVWLPIQYVHEFQYNVFCKRDGSRHETGNHSHPFSALTDIATSPPMHTHIVIRSDKN